MIPNKSLDLLVYSIFSKKLLQLVFNRIEHFLIAGHYERIFWSEYFMCIYSGICLRYFLCIR